MFRIDVPDGKSRRSATCSTERPGSSNSRAEMINRHQAINALGVGR
jgi:hypothetical protein